eukprot:sb/3470685/
MFESDIFQLNQAQLGAAATSLQLSPLRRLRFIALRARVVRVTASPKSQHSINIGTSGLQVELLTRNPEVFGLSPALARYFSNFLPYLILNRSHPLIENLNYTISNRKRYRKGETSSMHHASLSISISLTVFLALICAITPVCICITRPARGVLFPHISPLRSKGLICNISSRTQSISVAARPRSHSGFHVANRPNFDSF